MKKLFLIVLPGFIFFMGNLVAREIIGSPFPKKTTKAFSNPTDYFRSFQTGDWGATSTWESSPDNGVTPWVAATSTPTTLAATISIRSTHTVTVSTNQDMDEVSIESGGILLHSGGILAINDGTGDDVVVQNGGIFTLSFTDNPPVFSLATASAKITLGGILRVSAGGMTGNGTGINSINYIYQHGSILELTVVYSTNGVTYFPNVAVDTIPVFRSATNLNVGSGGLTTFNGLFEAVNSLNIDGIGQKIFRNGITGTGNINGANSGKFTINGTTAILGGSGTLTLPNIDGMDIGNNTTVTMTSNKSVTGNIALLTNALVMLDTYDLTMTGDISGGSATSHIVTNGSGKLVLNNITGATPRIFPIGGNTSSINPLAIFNGLGLNYGAKVEIGVNPTIRFPIAAVNRTWTVRASGTPGSAVNVNFFYSAGHGNALFNYTTTVEHGLYDGVAWQVIASGLVQAGSYQVASTVGIFAANTDAPMVIANFGAIVVVNNSVQLTVQKQNGKIMLNWSAASFSNTERFIAERSADGRTYSTIGELPSYGVSFTDVQPQPGLNYYRIKLIEKDGKISYSNITVILNEAKGIALIHISPNPVVSGNFKLNVGAAQKTSMEIVITDMQGRLLQKQTINTIAGSNLITINVAKLAAGTYQLYGISADGRSNILRFVKQ